MTAFTTARHLSLSETIDSVQAPLSLLEDQF
jgi:hypothetical protein